MTKSKANPKVDFYFNKTDKVSGGAAKWQEEFRALRKIVLECGLVEELKWGVPCYKLQKGNVVLMHGFKEYCALLFHKGALLKDTHGILIQQTANVQAARQIRFTNVREIAKMKTTLVAYIKEAIQIETDGLKVEFKKTTQYLMPDEFKNALDRIANLRTAFYSLTPGRQRGYLLYFSAPKQSKTRESRIEKCAKKILSGKGLDD